MVMVSSSGGVICPSVFYSPAGAIALQRQANALAGVMIPEETPALLQGVAVGEVEEDPGEVLLLEGPAACLVGSPRDTAGSGLVVGEFAEDRGRVRAALHQVQDASLPEKLDRLLLLDGLQLERAVHGGQRPPEVAQHGAQYSLHQVEGRLGRVHGHAFVDDAVDLAVSYTHLTLP